MNKITRYFKGVNKEAHRIRWPMKKFLWVNVLIVLALVVVACAVIFLLDFFTLKLFQGLHSNFNNGSSSSSSEVAALSALINSLM